jgi:hypothetical protein
MTRRLPATPPGPPAREVPPSEPPEDRPASGDRPRDPDLDEFDQLDGLDPLDLLDEELLDPDAFPDDPEDPVLTEALNRDAHHDLDALPSLEVDEPEQDVEVAIEDDRLEDDLVDLDAPDDVEMPLLPMATTVRLDGRTLPAVVDPGRERTTWLNPACEAPVATVALEIAGRTLRLQVACTREDSEPERVILGQDVLAGRFLLRP